MSPPNSDSVDTFNGTKRFDEIRLHRNQVVQVRKVRHESPQIDVDVERIENRIQRVRKDLPGNHITVACHREQQSGW